MNTVRFRKLHNCRETAKIWRCEPAQMTDDEKYMRLALVQARRAGARGEVPVGAVVVSGGRVVGRGHNRPIGSTDPTAHAEIVAIRGACRNRKNYRLTDCDLYVTLEPCSMCLGAVVQARLKKLVYGAPDPKTGAVRSIMRFPFEKLNHRPELKGGLLAEECRLVLEEFFGPRRKKRKAERWPSG